LQKNVNKINRMEASFQQLSNEQLKAKTEEFKKRLASGETLDDILPEAFATVREASRRTLGLRHFDVQLIGGMVLHEGNIAEMLTGEGKTLVATLPAYLNALAGKGVHIITVNDYLARRDAQWMSPIYTFLGMQVGVNVPGLSGPDKKAAYAADITYGTNNEFGFDYLRDNMAFTLVDKVQRGQFYAIVDEVDSILIDEARTPLIISGQTDESSEMYRHINAMVPKLKKQEQEEGEGDYSVDEKSKQAFLTEEGHQKVEEMLAQAGLLQKGASLYDAVNVTIMHYLAASLRAHALYHRDVDYIVKDGEVVIVDEHTGRLMQGRRWSDGLHQAVEAKEGVNIQTENQTLASITFQNYFRLYNKLAGMTGTADTEAYEFHQIYGLEVIVIPPNRPVKRLDATDKVYMNAGAKFNAIITEIEECQQRGQPVLVGTTSIETSELVSGLLKKRGIKHEVLNAKQHEREAHIIAQAGQPGAVTIATNMAGRGTDIVLGGSLDAEIAGLTDPTPEQVEKIKTAWAQRHEQVVQAGGLHVLGTERHESRRIDNQLRGRSGRQGDPGSSRFYLSLEDNLLRIFASERMTALMQRLGVGEDEVLESGMLTRVIENAQRKVEGHNFDIRKQLLEYDNVANEQRKVIYQQRDEVLASEDVVETMQNLLPDVTDMVVHTHVPFESFSEQWDIPALEQQLANDFGVKLDLQQWLAADQTRDDKAILQYVMDAMQQRYVDQEQQIGSGMMRQLEKGILLQTLDMHWKEHLAAMDHLRQGIHLRGYAQKNPKQEYKRESFELFTKMLDSLRQQVISTLCLLRVQTAEPAANTNMPPQPQLAPVMPGSSANTQQAPAFGAQVLSRNQACPCGSGK
ncbi:MAG: preprotein translocase subunit SecA, partial [Gammaproteobacteria bacterium]